MENSVDSSKEIFKFHYQSSSRRPKRLENNVFIIYSPERIRLQPGERKLLDMQSNFTFQKISKAAVEFLIHFKIKD